MSGRVRRRLTSCSAIGEREVADRPDVRAAQRHQVVDVGAPRPDAAQREQRRAPGVVVAARDAGEREAAVQHGRGERVAVRGLLAREAEPVQARGAALEHELRRHAAERRGHAAKEGARRGDRDLLLEHDVHQRREAGPPRPHRRQPVPAVQRGEIPVAAGERAHARGERLRASARAATASILKSRGFSRSLKW